jgi:hypothetical protein
MRLPRCAPRTIAVWVEPTDGQDCRSGDERADRRSSDPPRPLVVGSTDPTGHPDPMFGLPLLDKMTLRDSARPRLQARPDSPPRTGRRTPPRVLRQSIEAVARWPDVSRGHRRWDIVTGARAAIPAETAQTSRARQAPFRIAPADRARIQSSAFPVARPRTAVSRHRGTRNECRATMQFDVKAGEDDPEPWTWFCVLRARRIAAGRYLSAVA